MGIYGMQKAVSLLDIRRRISRSQVSLRGVRPYLRQAAAVLGILAYVYSPCSADQGYNVVQMSTAAPTGTQSAFLAMTTSFFDAGITKNPLVSNTYSIKIFGHKTGGQLIGSSFDGCISQGFSDGMDVERQSEMDSIKARQAVDASSQTCSGVAVDSTTAKDCQYVYGLILNDINQRWNTVFTSTGGVVAP